MCQGQGMGRGMGYGQRPTGMPMPGQGYGASARGPMNSAPQGYGMKPGMGMGYNAGGIPQNTGGTSYNNDPPINFGDGYTGPQIGPGPNGEQVLSRPYPGRNISINAPEYGKGQDPYGLTTGGNPSQPFMPGGLSVRAPMTSDMFGPNGGMKPRGQQAGGNDYFQGPQVTAPGGWQPSFGGNAPQPFFGNQQPQTGGPNTVNQPPITAQPPAQPPQPTGDVVADQRAMDAYNQQQFTKSGAAPVTQPYASPRPTTPMQPGQANWNYDHRNGQWSPAFMPGQNEYIVRSLSNPSGSGFNPWVSQINWGGNDIVDQIGRLSGNPFNPSQWSR